jgi:hypothetical protein
MLLWLAVHQAWVGLTHKRLESACRQPTCASHTRKAAYGSSMMMLSLLCQLAVHQAQG